LKTATDDLEAHLQNINDKLESIFSRTATESASDAAELQLIKEERASAQKCLQICAQLSDHINQIQFTPELPDSEPERVTTDGLQECKNSLNLTMAKLESYMKDRMDRLMTKSKGMITSEEDFADLEKLREEWETTRQSREICAKAEVHLRENISTIDNYATGDAIQFMVSTDGNIIRGTNRGVRSEATSVIFRCNSYHGTCQAFISSITTGRFRKPIQHPILIIGWRMRRVQNSSRGMGQVLSYRLRLLRTYIGLLRR
jgi:ElaB/YqjD/DUF883 family membrane-anchored ribosome-binding protein